MGLLPLCESKRETKNVNINYNDMEDKYFLNRNNKRSYTLQELINSGVIFNDDLIWKKGLSDWTIAQNIIELKDHVLERPPEKKSKIILKRIKDSIVPSIVILILFSVVLGITTGLLEKHQYNAFIEKVQPYIDKQIRDELEQAENQSKIEIDRERQKDRVNQSILNLNDKFEKRDKELESLQNEAYNNYLNSSRSYDFDYYQSLANGYIEQREKLLSEYQSEKHFLELSMPSDPNNLKSSSFSLVTYDVPLNTVYVDDENGKSYTRWTCYKGVGNHEQISYVDSHKFLFRSYKAIFSTVNLSENERENTLVLLWNFFTSALITNLLFFPFIVFGVMRYNKR